VQPEWRRSLPVTLSP